MNTQSVTSFLCWLLFFASLHAQEIDRSPEFQSPLPNSRFVSAETAIIFRPGPVLDRSSIADPFSVRGAISGRHDGRTILADDGRTLIFSPSSAFVAGEAVTVAFRSGVRSISGAAVPARSSTFTVGRQPADAEAVLDRLSDLPPLEAVTSTKERTSLERAPLPSDFPSVTVTNGSAPSAGQLYLSNFPFDATLTSAPYLLVLNNSGLPRYYKKMPQRCIDFKMLPNGMYSYYDAQKACFILLDSTYAVVDTFRCGNGYKTDLHDFQLLSNGHALLMSYDPQTVDMSTVVHGGSSHATVTGLIIQEVDASKNVVFQWRSWDHFQITDATHEDLASAVIDYVHGNSIDMDTDGNIILSSRHMDEITKIDRSTGEIIWRFGGKNNQFTFTNDTLAFSHQHDARRISNGHITLFDNGNYHVPAFSRALEYQLDETEMTATLVWQYRHSPDVVSSAMGNVQRLANGNTVIGWGAGNPNLTEVSPDGHVVYELTFPKGIVSYRSYRFPGPADTRVPLRTPADRASSVPTSTGFQWYPADAASSYRFQIATDPAFTSPLVDAVTTTTSRTITGLKGNVTYFWRVRATVDTGTAPWSETWSLRTIPDPVVLVSPGDAATGIELAPMVAWQPVDAALGYQVQVDTDPSFPDPVVNDTTGIDAQLSLDRLQPSTSYYWRVRALIDTVTSSWSASWSFTTMGVKEALALVSPANGKIDVPRNPILEWRPYSGPVSYELQVSKIDPRFTAIVVDDTVSATADPIASLDPGTLYYWRARPIVNGSAGDWSEVWYFQTGSEVTSLPPQVAPIFPPDQATVNTPDSLLFTWDPIDLPGVRYHLEVALDASFGQTVIDSMLTETSARVPRTRFGNAKYWWRVSAVDSSGQGPFSNGWSFTTEATAGVLDQTSTGAAPLAASLAPNPAVDGASLVLRLATPSHVAVTLVDGRGSSIATVFDGTVETGERRIAIDLRGIPSGLYFCRITSGSGTTATPIVITR